MTINLERAVEHLEKLAMELENRRFAVRMHAPRDRAPHLNVINTAAPVLTEKVLAAPDSDGTWAFHFPWPQLIAPVHDIRAAADRIERVLAEVDR
ncbi:hypothetical protein [Microtetraspora sp. NBRC 16547]|uniref:hypothetical protein n=1 Tax=Microtetraspora sp. NBRC 16547 TaxID=3030993 RepID=UPI0024A06FEC|nr:hypothetical protein [Microtetraspora sp. NBRC 16547]GLW98232.1 hypothetical protein Misp02_23190 [Microtetraspora sp. NBRC 16547]